MMTHGFYKLGQNGRFAALVMALLAGLPACGSKEDVSLAAYANSLKVEKAKSPFGFKMVGSFDLVFDLGSYSGQAVTVESASVSMLRDNKAILPKTKFSLASGTLPVTLDPGKKSTLAMTFTIEQLEADEIATLCAGPLSVGGTVKQAGKLEPLAINTAPVSPVGCP